MRSGVEPRVVAHEMLHVVDFSCGGPEGLSAEPEFVALYNAIVKGDAKPPSAYALHSTRELFTEGAVAFLGLSRDMSSRELRDSNPALWAYVENLFGERLPSVLEDKTVRPSSAWTKDLAAGVRLMHPLYHEPAGLIVDLQQLIASIAPEAELDGPMLEQAEQLRDQTRAYLARDIVVPKSTAFVALATLRTQLQTVARGLDDLLDPNA